MLVRQTRHVPPPQPAARTCFCLTRPVDPEPHGSEVFEHFLSMRKPSLWTQEGYEVFGV